LITKAIKIEADEVASTDEILSMNWFVDNVEAEEYINPYL